MHEHTRDAAAYFLTSGRVNATMPDGTVREGEPFDGPRASFNRRGIVHSEEWVSEGTRAIALELKADSTRPVSPAGPDADPVTSEPDTHRVLLENERVRLIETIIRRATAAHPHAHPARLVVQFVGCSALDAPQSAVTTPGGQRAWWAPAETLSHRAERVEGECRYVEMEVKGAE